MVVAETRLGWSGVALSAAGIRYSTLFHEDRETVVAHLRDRGAVLAADDRAEDIRAALAKFATDGTGSLDTFAIDLPACTEFERSAWLALRDIPHGETRSYGWLARHIGSPPSAVRAIGQAMGANPVPPWLPCHRVIASDGTLHGFGGGLDLKRRMLELEGALPQPLFALF